MAVIKKSLAEIEAMKEAGRISAKVLRMAGKHVEPGISTLELDNIVEKLIRLEGGIPAFKGYGGFPGSICASINEEIVHGIPSATKILKEGDIVSIDTGAIVDGWLVTTRDGMPSAHFEKTVAIMEDGPMVLTTEPMFRRPM